MADNSPIDFSKFSGGAKKEADITESGNFWQKMDKKNRMYFLIIIACVFLALILFVVMSGGKSKEASSGQYAPPAGFEGGGYTPPFP